MSITYNSYFFFTIFDYFVGDPIKIDVSFTVIASDDIQVQTGVCFFICFYLHCPWN